MRLLLLFALLSLVGCATATTQLTAKLTDKGHVEYGVQVQVK